MGLVKGGYRVCPVSNGPSPKSVFFYSIRFKSEALGVKRGFLTNEI